MADDRPRTYRPTKRLRIPPPWLTPAQKAAFRRQRVIESFVRDFFVTLPKSVDIYVTEFVHYANFAKQVWRFKDQIHDPSERDRQIDLKVGHWSEIIGLKEPVLRLLTTEILKTELALG